MRSGAARSVLAAIATYLALTVAYTWPLALHPGSLVPSDVGDPVLNTWILWWNALHWPFTAAWWNAPIFFPVDHALAFSEHLAGLWPIAAPIIRLSGNPLLGYNICLLLTFVLSALAAFALVLDLTGRRDAAFLAGLAFGFCPYRLAQLPHLQVLAAFWMPVSLLALHRFLRTRQPRWLGLFLASFVMQALTNGYYLVFFSVLTGLWLLWFIRPAQWRQGAAILGAWLAGVGVLLPVLLTYRAVHLRYGLERNVENMRFYSADVAALLSGPALRYWHLPSYGTGEGAFFTGIAVIALCLAGLIARRAKTPPDSAAPTRSAFGFYLIAAAALYVLAWGPSPSFLGRSLGIAGPYAWLASLPGFTALRVPARLGMLCMLCLSVAAGLAFARLSASWTARRQLVAVSVLAVIMAVESWPRAIPTWEPPAVWDVRPEDGSGPLIVLPLLNEMNEAASMYRGMFHQRPLVNGYSGHIPPWYLTLREGLNERDPAVLVELAKSGVTQAAVVIRNDPDSSWREYVATRATAVHRSADLPFALFNLAAPINEPPAGVRIPVVALNASVHPEIARTMLDDRRDTWWSTLAPQKGDEELVLDLGAAHLLGAVELDLANGFEFPRRLAIEVSVDGLAWTEAWNGPTAGLSAGALMRNEAHPVIRCTFQEQTARWVRLRQIGRHRSASWTIAGLRVLRSAQPVK